MAQVLFLGRRGGRSAPTIIRTQGGGPSAAVESPGAIIIALEAAPLGKRRSTARTVIGPWDWGAAVNFAPPPIEKVAPAFAPMLVRRAVRRRLMLPPAALLLPTGGYGTPGRHPLRMNFASMVKTVDFS